MILLESKRDDLLLPYIELLKSKGVNCTLGQFKSYMLRKLTEEGHIRNLSLSSNFYLAGAVRYYFNGDLTLNKDLDVFNDGNTKNDVWNETVCIKLNALINILRNAYIDTVGETFEQPEDFGNLKIDKLLKKYNKKIEAELSNGTEVVDVTNTDDGLDRNENVGNGYTFEILYNYNQGTKYETPTSPGSWCITYGKHHYDGYVKRLGIHYVIFRKDGWENVERVKGPEWTKQKPQDEYGCSLIAVLQSNRDGEPIYITSRWNHGSWSDDSSCEADHAFSKEEFFKKTGVTDVDLQRIFEIWKKDKKLYGENNDGPTDTVPKTEKIAALRQIKYAQMRINGGDLNVSNLFRIHTNLGGPQYVASDGSAKINKGIYWCITTFPSEHSFYFLIDRGKINFDTFMSDDMEPYVDTSMGQLGRRSKLENFNNLAVIGTKKFIMLYDLRKRTIINVDGVTKFKCFPQLSNWNLRGAEFKSVFYELKVSKLQSAVMNVATNQPLRLPNGSYFVNRVNGNGFKYTAYNDVVGRSNLHASVFGGEKSSYLDLVYDLSSGERYVYSIDEKRFLSDEEIPKDENDGLVGIIANATIPGFTVWHMLTPQNAANGRTYREPMYIYDKNNQRVSFVNVTEFEDLKYLGGGLVRFSPYTRIYIGYGNREYRIYNINTDSFLRSPNNGELIDGWQTESSDDSTYSESRLIFIKGKYNSKFCYIYDKKDNKFLENPFGWPNKYTFQIEKNGRKDGSGVVYIIKEDGKTWWSVYSGGFGDESWKEDNRRLYVPGANNSDIYSDDERWGGIKLDRDLNNDNYNINDIKDIVTEVINKLLKS
jgi:hypothetical protein